MTNDMHIDRLDSLERSALSATTRQVLAHFAAGDPRRPLPLLPDVDWEAVFQGVCSNGLLGLTQHYLARQAGHAPPASFCRQVQAAQRLNSMRIIVMQRKIRPVLATVARSGLDCMVIKGPAVACTVYPDPLLRGYNDLDLLVRMRDWTAMHQVLRGLGFRPEADMWRPPPGLVPEDVPYELKYRHPQTGLLVEVHYDDILNAGLAARDVEGFWQRSVCIDIEGVTVRVMALEDQLVHLCAHAHYHGYTRLNWFSDIALIVRDHAERLDWERVLATVRIEEAQVAVYYSLVFLEQLLGVAVPGGVCAALRPDWLRRRLHEYYLPAAKVVSLDPMWRPDFSFYFLPLFKRLLPDLLVMGRRRDKLRYLRRLWWPPADWLRHYYRLGDTANVGMHYVLHPLKLLYHYGAEVVAVERR